MTKAPLRDNFMSDLCIAHLMFNQLVLSSWLANPLLIIEKKTNN